MSPIHRTNERAAAVTPRAYGIDFLDRASAEAPATSVDDDIQRVVTVVDDAGAKYGPSFDGHQAFYVLDKPKQLYVKPKKTAQNVIADIPAGRYIKITQAPSGGAFARSWAEIEVYLHGKKRTGYINTKEITAHPYEHLGAGAVMDKAGPSPEDIEQGAIGDCFLLAALMSLSRRNPADVRALFVTDPTVDRSDHTLRFFHATRDWNGKRSITAENVIVDNTVTQARMDLVAHDGSSMARAGTNFGARGAWNWPAIVEKAYMAWPNNQQYVADTFANLATVSIELTGKSYVERQDLTSKAIGSDADQKLLITALETNAGIVIANTSKDPPDSWTANNVKDGQGEANEAMWGGIVFGHAYEVVAADAGNVWLRNPWGQYSRVNQRTEKHEAVSELTWKEFGTVIAGWSCVDSTPTDSAAAPSGGDVSFGMRLVPRAKQ